MVDLAFREDDAWTVVDFKTDREFEGSSDRYIAQVNLYSKAVGAATGSPTRGVVLVLGVERCLDKCGQTELPDGAQERVGDSVVQSELCPQQHFIYGVNRPRCPWSLNTWTMLSILFCLCCRRLP